MDININNIITSISNKNNFLNCIIDYCKNFKSKNDTNIYLVGGIVRDSFIDKSITKNMDIDIAVDGDIDKFVNEISRDLSIDIQNKAHNFLNYKLITRDSNFSIDVAHTRKEKYSSKGDLPKWEKAGIIEDMYRRDITINAISVEITNNDLCLIDKLGGIKDIKNKTIKLIHDKSLEDDPTRIYRAIKYKTRLDFSFDLRTYDYLLKSFDELRNISNFRKYNEILKIINEDKPEKIATFINKNKKFLSIFPESFLEKIHFIDKDFWDNSSKEIKIFFSLFNNRDFVINEFLESLNFSKKEKKYINGLYELKDSPEKNLKNNYNKELLANLYHCL